MTIPTLSSEVIRGPYVEQQNRRTIPLIDYEMGGPVLNAPSVDLNTHLWTATSDGSVVTVHRPDVAPVIVLTDTGITQIALGFDQTMRPHIAYVVEGVTKFRWFDSLLNAMTTTTIPNAITPRLCMDEKRGIYAANSDLILSYMNNSALCVRVQRERYQTEHVLETDLGPQLVKTGLNTANRLQWNILPPA